MCDKVRDWASQDYIPQTEELPGRVEERSSDDRIGFTSGGDLGALTGPAIGPHQAAKLMKSLKMPQDMIDIVVMHAISGRKVRDIAVALGISSSVVSQRFTAAKYQLVRRLQRRMAWELVQKFKLSKHQKEICKLYFFDLLGNPEIARIKNLKPPQVSTMLNRIKVKITLTMWSIKEGDGACKWFQGGETGITEIREEINYSARKRNDYKMLSMLTDIVNNL